MLKTYKTEIKPSKDQIILIKQYLGTCRFVYNLYLETNINNYKNNIKFMSGFNFSKYLNNIYLNKNKDKLWIKESPSKSIKESIMNAENSFKQFFKRKYGFPKFKKKNRDNISLYFPKNNKTDLKVERHRIKIPKLGWIRLKEYGYIPDKIKSCTIAIHSGRYYISCLCELDNINKKYKHTKEGVGIDLGISNLCVTSDGRFFKNINKSTKVKRIEKRLFRKQRSLSRKYENKKKERNATNKNIDKNKSIIQNIYNRLSNIRKEYIKSVINNLIRAKLGTFYSFVTIEDLNIKNMMKNKHLSKHIQNQMFYYFKLFLINQCNKYDIEVRQVSSKFPSTQLCSECNTIVKKKLSDRVHNCPVCGLKLDRDLNASINLQKTKNYNIIN